MPTGEFVKNLYPTAVATLTVASDGTVVALTMIEAYR
jgi:hypothetical protein